MRVVEFGFWMPIETKVRVLIETADTLASWIEWQGKGWDGCKSKSRSVAMPILAWHRNSCSSLDSGRAPSHAPHEHAFPVTSDRNDLWKLGRCHGYQEKFTASYVFTDLLLDLLQLLLSQGQGVLHFLDDFLLQLGIVALSGLSDFLDVFFLENLEKKLNWSLLKMSKSDGSEHYVFLKTLRDWSEILQSLLFGLFQLALDLVLKHLSCLRCQLLDLSDLGVL